MSNIFDNHLMIRAGADIAKICEPLKKFFNINDFNYEKIYKDNSKIKLTSRPDWMLCYYKQGFQYMGEYEVSFDQFQSGYKLTSVMSNQCIFTTAREEFNIDNGLVLVDKYDDYCELFWFGSIKGDHQAINFYINNMDLLRRFILYFKEKAADIIERANKERIVLPDKKIIIQGKSDLSKFSKRNNFIKAIRVEHYRLSGKYSHISLTEREFECAVCMLEGKTAEHTGNDLGLSRRTVETHLSNLRSKVDCNTKSELAEILLKNGFGFYANKDVMFI
jgi:LuxR family transcriptional regulator, quorum-sensing system regulator SolR